MTLRDIVDLFSDDLGQMCANGTVTDPSCPCLVSGGGPELNTDISGPGVRISFYLQALFLSLLSARSGSLEQITGALYTLIATNIAMVVTSFILGFKQKPTMSLHDAIVVFYLLSLSWASVFTSMPAYNRFVRSDKTLQVISMIQSYLIFAFALAVLIKARTFGSTPHCNMHAVAVVFKQFRALDAGRIVAFVVLGIVIIVYTFLSVADYRRPIVRRYRASKRWLKSVGNWGPMLNVKAAAIRAGSLLLRKPRIAGPDCDAHINSPNTTRPPRMPRATPSNSKGKMRQDGEVRTQAKKDEKLKRKAMKRKLGGKHKYLDVNPTAHPSKNPKQYDAGIFGTLLIELIVIITLWALFLMNTELLILRNHFLDGGDSGGSGLWQFGQILPMFLVVLPLVNLIKVFHKLGFTRRFHRRRVHRRRTRAERREARQSTQAGLGTMENIAEGLGSRPTTQGGSSQGNFFGSGWQDIPFFFPFFPQSPPLRAAGLGGQPSAHISLHSIHSANSMPTGSGEGGEEVLRVRRRFDSALSSSSSYTSSSSKRE